MAQELGIQRIPILDEQIGNRERSKDGRDYPLSVREILRPVGSAG